MKCTNCSSIIISFFNCKICSQNFCSLSCVENHYSKYHLQNRNLVVSPFLVKGVLKNQVIYDPFFNLKNFVPVYDELGKIKIIGSGSYGQVYLAMNILNKKCYAIKHMDKKKLYSLLHSLNSIQKEIEIQSRIDHPNIVSLLYVKETNYTYDLIMEYASDGSLFHYIRKYKGLSEDKTFSLFMQVVNAINFLHQNDLIHRDIKPENLLMFGDNLVKLCDFGWCVKLEGHQRSTFCGTTEYMSPELVNHEGYGKEIDVWSLGILLYEMIHGYSPFRPNKPKFNERDVMDNIKNHNLIFGKKVSEECKDLIYHLLDPNIELRYKVEDIYNSNFVKRYEVMDNYLKNGKENLNYNNMIYSDNNDNYNTIEKYINSYTNNKMSESKDFDSYTNKNIASSNENNYPDYINYIINNFDSFFNINSNNNPQYLNNNETIKDKDNNIINNDLYQKNEIFQNQIDNNIHNSVLEKSEEPNDIDFDSILAQHYEKIPKDNHRRKKNKSNLKIKNNDSLVNNILPKNDFNINNKETNCLDNNQHFKTEYNQNLPTKESINDKSSKKNIIKNIDNNINYNYYYNFNNFNCNPIINNLLLTQKSNDTTNRSNNNITPSTVQTSGGTNLYRMKDDIKNPFDKKKSMKISEFEIGEENYNSPNKDPNDINSFMIKINKNNDQQEKNRKYWSKSDYYIIKENENKKNLNKSQFTESNLNILDEKKDNIKIHEIKFEKMSIPFSSNKSTNNIKGKLKKSSKLSETIENKGINKESPKKNIIEKVNQEKKDYIKILKERKEIKGNKIVVKKEIKKKKNSSIGDMFCSLFHIFDSPKDEKTEVNMVKNSRLKKSNFNKSISKADIISKNINSKIINLKGNSNLKNSNSTNNINQSNLLFKNNKKVNSNSEFNKDIHLSNKTELKPSISSLNVIQNKTKYNKIEKIIINNKNLRNNKSELNMDTPSKIFDSKLVTPKKKNIYRKVCPAKLIGEFKYELTNISKRGKIVKVIKMIK